MARRIGELTALAVQRAKEPGRFADGAGLYLVVTATRSRNWCFRYHVHGKAHELGLGACHTVTLAEAREKARRLRNQLLDKLDPLAERRAAKAAQRAMTFRQAAETYIAAQSVGWSQRSLDQWRASLRDRALPVIGDRPVSAIDIAAVLGVLTPIWATKTETASSVRQRIEAILAYATVQGWRAGDNPAQWTGRLALLLPAEATVKPVVHHPAMSWNTVRAIHHLGDEHSRQRTAQNSNRGPRIRRPAQRPRQDHA